MKKIVVWCVMALCAVAANAGLVWELNANSFTNAGPYADGETWSPSTGSVAAIIRDQNSGTMTRSSATVAGGVSSTVIPYALVKDTYVHNNADGLGGRGTPVTGTTSVSFELWTGSSDTNHSVQTVFETGGEGKGLGLTIASNQICLAIGGTVAGGGNIVTNVPETFFDGNLNQVVLTYDSSSGAAAIYYNGSLLVNGSVGAGVDWNGSDPFGIWGGAGAIGAHTLDIITDENVLGGMGDIGRIRMYDNVLSSAEVADSFNQVVPEPATLGLIGIASAGLLMARRLRM